MKPALTPEEWAIELAQEDAHGWPVGDPRARVGFDGDSWHPKLHALAALCLHGQPFGFTREDVAFLRETTPADCGINGYTEKTARRRLANLADRIEALLAPVEGT